MVLETVYAHLSKQLVEENQIVKKGEVIGKGGTTGNARGSHLHLEVRYQGVTINPEYFFDFESDVIISDASWVTEDDFGSPAFFINQEEQILKSYMSWLN